MKHLWIFAVLAVAMTACGGSETPDDPPTQQTSVVGDPKVVDDYPTITAPDGQTVWKPPFSAADIREGTPDGLTQHIVMFQNDQRFVIRVAFSAPDESGVTIENVPVDGNGQPLGEGKSARTDWAELESHAYYDVDTTTVATTKVATPMGKHDALVFTEIREKNGASHVERSWFALDLPGAPVRYEKSVDGETVMTMEIVHRAVATPTTNGEVE